jgi:hypothetical protein
MSRDVSSPLAGDTGRGDRKAAQEHRVVPVGQVAPGHGREEADAVEAGAVPALDPGAQDLQGVAGGEQADAGLDQLLQPLAPGPQPGRHQLLGRLGHRAQADQGRRLAGEQRGLIQWGGP